MKKDYKIISNPKWIKKLIRNSKQRERYFIKRYGTLERMYNIDTKLQAKLDDDSFNDEWFASQ